MEPTGQRFHEGERRVQERAGLRDRAERVGRTFGRTIPEAARDFLKSQTFAILGGRDLANRPWASLLGGPEGFLCAESEGVLRIGRELPSGGPLAAALQPGDAAGLLVIEMATRRRMRLNGRLLPAQAGEMRVAAEEVYSNCPKYIQARTLVLEQPEGPWGDAVTGSSLAVPQMDWIREADTCFIATAHPERGADASHRGGAPGFIRVLDRTTLLLPDYPGNGVFQTVGNLDSDPALGLLLLDFHSDRLLQLTGRGEILWEGPELASMPGAERVLRIHLGAWIERPHGMRFRWGAPQPSPFNP